MNNATVAQQYIDQIWNKQDFDKISGFLHADFKDHGLPPALPTNAEGTKQWILGTSAAFEHHTLIEEQVTEGDKSIVKIRMNLRHIGPWRGIEPTGIALHTVGYRQFKFKDEKIIEHWALVDGQAIENQLRNAAHGCKIAE